MQQPVLHSIDFIQLVPNYKNRVKAGQAQILLNQIRWWSRGHVWTVVGQFGTGQFGTRIIWHQDNLAPDNLAPGQFGTNIIKTDNLAPDNLAPGQFGTNIIKRTVWHQEI